MTSTIKSKSQSSNKTFLITSIFNGQFNIQFPLRKSVKVSLFHVGEHDVCSPINVACSMPDHKLERLKWRRRRVERCINTGVELLAHEASPIVGTRNISLVGVNPTALDDPAALNLATDFGNLSAQTPIFSNNSFQPLWLHARV